MFLKAFKVKSNNQLKASDKKQLKDEFKRFFPNLTEQNLDETFSKKELISVVKIETASHTTVQVYVANKRPIAFLHDNILFPTIYFLWQYPNIVLTFTTHEAVLCKLADGAHLMLPGVIHPNLSGSSEIPNFSENVPACINLMSNKAAVAVGVTAQSLRDMIKSQNRGKCITVYHVLGDKLCTLDNLPCLTVPNLGSLEKNQGHSPDNNCVEENASTFEELSLKDANDELENTITEDNTTVNLKEEPCSVEESTAEEIDSLINHCFLATVKYCKDLDLPMLTSTFYKVYMTAACPPGRILDIKKSSYKKLKNFLQDKTELGIIKVEEQKKGVDVISEINREHPLVIQFSIDPSERPKKINKQGDDSFQPSIVEAHSVTAKVVPIFSEFGFAKGSVISNSDIRKYITEFIKKHKLQSDQNKNCVILNDFLKTLCREDDCVTWQILIERIYSHMSPCYKITCGDNEVIRKGKLDTIDISVAKRSGNKKVTLVDNIEIYGINIEELATYCQRAVAASTSINRSQTAKKTDQLQIQGNQVLFVYNLLIDKYKVPKKYIKGLEFAPKKKQ